MRGPPTPPVQGQGAGGPWLPSAALPPYSRDSLQISIPPSCPPCPPVFKHNNNLNEIMRETHSDAVEETVLLLRQQRELIECTGEKEGEGMRRAGGTRWKAERLARAHAQARTHVHTHARTHALARTCAHMHTGAQAHTHMHAPSARTGTQAGQAPGTGTGEEPCTCECTASERAPGPGLGRGLRRPPSPQFPSGSWRAALQQAEHQQQPVPGLNSNSRQASTAAAGAPAHSCKFYDASSTNIGVGKPELPSLEASRARPFGPQEQRPAPPRAAHGRPRSPAPGRCNTCSGSPSHTVRSLRPPGWEEAQATQRGHGGILLSPLHRPSLWLTSPGEAGGTEEPSGDSSAGPFGFSQGRPRHCSDPPPRNP